LPITVHYEKSTVRYERNPRAKKSAMLDYEIVVADAPGQAMQSLYLIGK